MTSTGTTRDTRQAPGSDDADELVRLDNAGFHYRDGTQAIASVSLEARRGQVISIVGPSGCGKSTLLSLIAGLAEPTSGSVSWQGKNRLEKGHTAGLFTILFQKDTLLPWLTVRSNVGFGLRYTDLSKTEKQARIERLLRMGGLTDFAETYPNQLSGGMRRRAGFLSSVAPFPKMLLLDEPFSALDEPTRVTLHGDIRSIIAELGMTVILVTHDLGEAITLSDKVVILTKRPARVAEVHDIDLGPERDVFAVRESEEYQEIYTQLWAGLRHQIASE